MKDFFSGYFENLHLALGGCFIYGSVFAAFAFASFSTFNECARDARIARYVGFAGAVIFLAALWILPAWQAFTDPAHEQAPYGISATTVDRFTSSWGPRCEASMALVSMLLVVNLPALLRSKNAGENQSSSKYLLPMIAFIVSEMLRHGIRSGKWVLLLIGL